MNAQPSRTIPIVDATITNRDELHFFCEHCRRKHRHGLGTTAIGALTHRIQHCTKPDHPYEGTGYYLRVCAPVNARKH